MGWLHKTNSLGLDFFLSSYLGEFTTILRNTEANKKIIVLTKLYTYSNRKQKKIKFIKKIIRTYYTS